jgi:hypothetical protein
VAFCPGAADAVPTERLAASVEAVNPRTIKGRKSERMKKSPICREHRTGRVMGSFEISLPSNSLPQGI